MPEKFKFSLQKILDFRSQEEEKSVMDLAEAETSYKRQEEYIQNLNNNLQQVFENLNNQVAVSAGSLWLWSQYRERILQELQEAKSELHNLARKVNLCRQEVIAKSKERKKLEKLKFKQLLLHTKTEQQKEQNFINEMASLHYPKKNF